MKSDQLRISKGDLEGWKWAVIVTVTLVRLFVMLLNVILVVINLLLIILV